MSHWVSKDVKNLRDQNQPQKDSSETPENYSLITNHVFQQNFQVTPCNWYDVKTRCQFVLYVHM